MPGRGRWLGALLIALVLVAAGCGVPDAGPATAVPPEEVPYGLLGTGPPTASVGRDEDARAGPGVYFVRGDRLVRLGLDPGAPSGESNLALVLRALTTGPTAGERLGGMGTAIPAGLQLRGTVRPDGTAEIELVGDTAHPEVDQNVLAAGQIALTATSVAGVDAVILLRDGQRVECALPSGELATRPVTGADYALLVGAGSPRPTPSTPETRAQRWPGPRAAARARP